jgi:carboxymethylenebutenolidase
MGERVTFASGEETTTGYLAVPGPDRARGRGVVVIQEGWGLADHVKKVADRFAAEGFHALAPELSHGTAARSSDEEGRLPMALDVARAENDLRGAVERLRYLTGRRVGTVGFCAGGALSLLAACSNPEGVAACVVYYGGHPRVEYDLDRLRAPVLGHWAEKDDLEADVPRLEAELGRRGLSFEFHTYPGTRHAFFDDERPEVYARDAAETSWERTIDFLARHL